MVLFKKKMPRKMMNKANVVIIFVFAACLLCGCMHYSKGTGSDIPFTTIYIEPVKNDALVHHIRATLSSQIRQKIAKHPQLTLLNSNESADACLTVKIKDFSQSVATTKPDDTVRAKSFTLEITAECSLFDNRTGQYLFKQHIVSASIESQAEGDYLWNKTKTLPQLSDKLADKIYDVVCKPW